MSRTRKDSNQIKNTVLVVKKDDGIFDLFLNRKLDRNDVLTEYHGLIMSVITVLAPPATRGYEPLAGLK